MLFLALLPGLPRVREFVDLARGTRVGIYPTLFTPARWLHPDLAEPGTHEPPIEPGDVPRMVRYKKELCAAALAAYEQGADVISTFNWWPHHRKGLVKDPSQTTAYEGDGAKQVMMYVCSVLGDQQRLKAYSQSDAVEPEGNAKR
jgi:hypothetical protein